jgi:DNA-binding NarL/FixJ family response regulator
MNSSPQIRVMVIDDHSIVRQGLIALLNTEDDLTVIAEGSDGAQAIDLFKQHTPDVTLMDLRMPGIGGVEAINHIRRMTPDAKIIVLTTYDGDEDIFRALQAGAQSYLLKGVSFEDLTEAIRIVHAGHKKIPPAVAERLAERFAVEPLTGREQQVLELIVGGKSNKEIGTALKISEATVKSHINSLLSKLGVTDRTQAATTAIQRGLVHLD